MSKHVTTIALSAHVYLSRLIVLFACVCALAVLLYGIFLLEAVAHAASQTSAQRRISQVTAQLGTLEEQYLSASKDLTPQMVAQMGYVAPTEVTTVFATQSMQALSLSGR